MNMIKEVKETKEETKETILTDRTLEANNANTESWVEVKVEDLQDDHDGQTNASQDLIDQKNDLNESLAELNNVSMQLMEAEDENAPVNTSKKISPRKKFIMTDIPEEDELLGSLVSTSRSKKQISLDPEQFQKAVWKKVEDSP